MTQRGAKGAKNLQVSKKGENAHQHKTAGLWTQLMFHPNLDIVLRGLDMEAEHLSLSSTQRCQQCNRVPVE